MGFDGGLERLERFRCGLIDDATPVATEIELASCGPIGIGNTDEDKTDRFGASSAARTGNAGGSDRKIRLEELPGALSHCLGTLLTDRTKGRNDALRNTQDAGFHRIVIGNDAAEEVARAAGDRREPSGDVATGTRFGSGDRSPGLTTLQLGNDRFWCVGKELEGLIQV